MKVFRRGRPGGRLIAVGALAVVGLTASAPSAAASSASQSVTGAGEGRILQALATCPKNQRATGGGFATLKEPSEAPFIVIFESRKINQNAWQVQGQITDSRRTNETQALIAEVYCSKSAPKTKTAELVNTSGNGLTLWASEPSCSQSQFARAGGFSGIPPIQANPPGAINHQVGSSLLLGIGGVAPGPFKAHHSTILTAVPNMTYTTYAYCARKSAGKVLASVGQTDNATNAAKVDVLSASCAKGMRPESGGFNQPNYSFSSPNLGWYSELWISIKSGNQWRVSAIHHGSAATQLQSFVYCSKAKRASAAS